jgi:acetoin utilization protein AcuB
MSRDVATIDAGTPVADAGVLMAGRGIRRLPVLSGGRLAGILSYSDLRALPAAEVTGRTAGELMTRDPLTVSPDETIGRAAQIMLQHRISGLPVVDHHGELVGIITESDIFKLVVRDWLHKAGEEPEPYARYD